jgi:hypothetical protein
MMKPTPVFRSIGQPLDVSDDALNKISDKLGVPSLVKPDSAPALSPVSAVLPGVARTDLKPASHAPLPATVPAPVPVERISVDLPTYLGTAMRVRVAEEGTTMRFLVMQGLQALGFKIDPSDFISDGRSMRGKAR